MSVAVADENPIWRKMLTDWTKSRSQWVLFAWNIQVWFFFRSKLKTNIRRKTHSSRSQAFITFLFLWFFSLRKLSRHKHKNSSRSNDPLIVHRNKTKHLHYARFRRNYVFAPIYKIKKLNWNNSSGNGNNIKNMHTVNGWLISWTHQLNWTELTHKSREKKVEMHSERNFYLLCDAVWCCRKRRNRTENSIG